MKKCLSMFLVLALLVTLYGGAFADTLQLPGSLTTIEAESFSDNPALDEVSVAWGTETIESRAFASSGVKKIYIPATVTAIADDAFAGTSVTICSAADAYAKEYADAHGLAWEDSGSSSREAVTALLEFANTPVEGGKLEVWEYLSTEGVTDPEELAGIEEYNSIVAEINPLIEDYTAEIEDLSEAAEAMGDRLSDISVSSKNGVVALSMGGINLMVDEALAQGVDFTEVEETTGGVLRLTAPDGKVGYLAISGDALVLSRSPAVANGLAMRNGAVDHWREALRNLANTVRDTLFFIKDQKIDSFIDKAADAASQAERKIKKLEETKVKHRDENWKNWNKRRLNELHRAQSNLRNLRVASVALNTITSGLSAWNVFITLDKWDQLSEIEAHFHPNLNDRSQEAIRESKRLRSHIDNLSKSYASSICMDIVNVITGAIGLISSISALVTAATGVLSPLSVPLASLTAACRIISAISIALGLVNGIWGDALEMEIKEIEKKLHTYVYGWVKERGTGKPIEGVKVTDGEVTTVTDGNGYYELYLMPEPTSLVFTHDDYEKDGIVATPVAGEGTRLQDMELKIGEKGIPIDEEHFPDEAFRSHIAGQYDKNKDGRLSQEERDAVVTVTVRGLGIRSLQGIAYFEQMDSLYCENNRITTLDLRANKKLAWLWCCQNELTSLDLRGYEELKGLYCYGNFLSAVDASGCAKLRYVELSAEHDGVFLETSCGSLNLSGCEKLEELKCNQCRLGSLNVAGCGKLFDVHLEGCGLTGVLDLSLADTLSECKFKGNGFASSMSTRRVIFTRTPAATDKRWAWKDTKCSRGYEPSPAQPVYAGQSMLVASAFGMETMRFSRERLLGVVHWALDINGEGVAFDVPPLGYGPL